MFARLRKYRFLLALLVPTMPVIGYVYEMNYYTLIVGILVLSVHIFAISFSRAMTSTCWCVSTICGPG